MFVQLKMWKRSLLIPKQYGNLAKANLFHFANMGVRGLVDLWISINIFKKIVAKTKFFDAQTFDTNVWFEWVKGATLLRLLWRMQGLKEKVVSLGTFSRLCNILHFPQKTNGNWFYLLVMLICQHVNCDDLVLLLKLLSSHTVWRRLCPS